MQNYEISEELVQQLLNYLADRKYKEVIGFISKLMQLKKVEQKPNDPQMLGKIEKDDLVKK
jgi:hypothetical protein